MKHCHAHLGGILPDGCRDSAQRAGMLPGRHQLVLVRLFCHTHAWCAIILEEDHGICRIHLRQWPTPYKVPSRFGSRLGKWLGFDKRNLETVQPRRPLAQLLAEAVFKDQCQLRRRRAEGLEAGGAELPCSVRDDQWGRCSVLGGLEKQAVADPILRHREAHSSAAVLGSSRFQGEEASWDRWSHQHCKAPGPLLQSQDGRVQQDWDSRQLCVFGPQHSRKAFGRRWDQQSFGCLGGALLPWKLPELFDKAQGRHWEDGRFANQTLGNQLHCRPGRIERSVEWTGQEVITKTNRETNLFGLMFQCFICLLFSNPVRSRRFICRAVLRAQVQWSSSSSNKNSPISCLTLSWHVWALTKRI